MTRNLYHLTRRGEAIEIVLDGLDPTRSTGKRQVSWLCDATRLSWAVKHLSKHHGWNPSELYVLRVTVRKEDVRRYRRGVFTCKVFVPGKYVRIESDSAEHMIEELRAKRQPRE